MSQENVEIVREQFELWRAGDVAGMAAACAEDAELRTDPRFPEGGTFRGRATIRRFYEQLRVGWKTVDAVPEEFEEVGDCVVVRAAWGGTGEASAIEVVMPLTTVWELENGEIVSLRFFFEHAEALEAVGLSE